MITVDAVATAAMVRFGSDAELDVTVNKKREEENEKTYQWKINEMYSKCKVKTETEGVRERQSEKKTTTKSKIYFLGLAQKQVRCICYSIPNVHSEMYHQSVCTGENN